MATTMKNVTIIDCGTGIKAVGNIDLDIDNLHCENNGRDLVLEVTQDSKINIDNFFAKGTKFESVLLKDYNSKLISINKFISQVPDLSQDDKNLIAQKLNLLKDSKEQSLWTKVLTDIKSSVKSVSGQVVVNLITDQMTRLFS